MLTASDLNAEFNNVLNNPVTLWSPAGSAVNFNGQTITLDAAAVTTLVSSAAVSWNFTSGAKTGTPATTGSIANWSAQTFTDSATAGSGTATSFAAHAFQRPTLAATNASVTTTNAATIYVANAPAAGTNETLTNAYALWVDDGAARFDGSATFASTVTLAQEPAAALQAVPLRDIAGFIQGLTYSNNAGDATNDIDIAAGVAVDSTNVSLLRLSATLTKQSDVAWAVGSGNGGLDTGAVGNSDYYIWLIQRPDTGVVDALYSLSSTAPTMPTNYTLKRLIGWIKRVGGTIVAINTYELFGGGIELLWTAPTLDVNLANTLTTARRTDAVKVPLNFSVEAHLNVVLQDLTSNEAAWICCPDQTDAAPSITVAPLTNIGSTTTVDQGRQLLVRTSATGTIAARSNLATVDLYAVATMGFRWARRN